MSKNLELRLITFERSETEISLTEDTNNSFTGKHIKIRDSISVDPYQFLVWARIYEHWRRKFLESHNLNMTFLTNSWRKTL